jgi:FkbM family methyltransferase
LAPSGHHYAFEPIPELAAGLREKYPTAEVRQLALSDTAGEATFFHVVTNPGYSGLRRRTYDRPRERIERITVRTERLDDVLPPDLPVDFIKVDVEGAELQVFRGAARTLRSYHPTVVFEHELGGAAHYRSSPHAVYDFLVRDCALRIFRLEGDGPLTESKFASVFEGGDALNFLAHR